MNARVCSRIHDLVTRQSREDLAELADEPRIVVLHDEEGPGLEMLGGDEKRDYDVVEFVEQVPHYPRREDNGRDGMVVLARRW